MTGILNYIAIDAVARIAVWGNDLGGFNGDNAAAVMITVTYHRSQNQDKPLT